MVTLVFVLLAFALPQLVKLACNPLGELIPQLLEDMAEMVAYGQEPDERWVFYMTSQIVGSSMVIVFLSVLFSLFAMVMRYGYRSYALRVFVRQKAGVGSIFSAFPMAGKVIGTEIMTAIFTFLWSLLIQAVGMTVLGLGGWLLGDVLGLAWAARTMSMLGSLVISFLSWLVSLRYCLAPYFIMSDPDKGVFEAITASRQAMAGHYGKKLVLDLSFLGWGALVMLIIYIVCILGTGLVLFTAGAPWLLQMEELSHYVMSDWETAYYVLLSLADLIRDVMVPMTVVLGVAWLAALPLNLWLMAYETVAEAGFFLTVTGRVLVVSDEPAPADPVPPVPGVPTVPVAPPPVISGPSEPPVGADVPIGPAFSEPEPPVTPEPPAAPAEPEPPVDPEPPMPGTDIDPTQDTVGADVLIGPASDEAEPPADSEPPVEELSTDEDEQV